MKSAKLRLPRPETADTFIKAILAIFVALAVIGSATAGPPGLLRLAFVVATDSDVRARFLEARRQDLVRVTRSEETSERVILACDRLVIDCYVVYSIPFETILDTATADMMQTLGRPAPRIYLAGPLERQQINQEYKKARNIQFDLESKCSRYTYDSPQKSQCEASMFLIQDHVDKLRQRFEEDKRRQPPQESDPEDSKYLDMTPAERLEAERKEYEERAVRGIENIFRAISGVPGGQKAETIPQTSSEFAAFVAQSCPKYWGSLPQSERSRLLTAYPGTSEDVKRATVQQCVDRERTLTQ